MTDGLGGNTMQHADVLVYDVGTSSLKLVLYGENGQIVRQQSISYDYQTPHADWAEIDPAVWANALWEGLEAFARDGLLNHLRAISGTGQMHSGVLLDEAGQALSPCILWLDRRAEQETLELGGAFQAAALHANTTYTLPKIAWLNKHRPDVLSRARRLLWPRTICVICLRGLSPPTRPKAWGRRCLTGAPVNGPPTGSRA
jgi:xylulokinase